MNIKDLNCISLGTMIVDLSKMINTLKLMNLSHGKYPLIFLIQKLTEARMWAEQAKIDIGEHNV
mgnify:CR=1 FL=1